VRGPRGDRGREEEKDGAREKERKEKRGTEGDLEMRVRTQHVAPLAPKPVFSPPSRVWYALIFLCRLSDTLLRGLLYLSL